MKSKFLKVFSPIVIAFALTGCDRRVIYTDDLEKVEEKEEDNTDELIANLKSSLQADIGFEVNCVTETTTNGVSTTSELTGSIYLNKVKTENAPISYFRNVTTGETTLSDYYLAGDDGKIYTEILSNDNQVIKSLYDESATFDSTFINPFENSLLTYSLNSSKNVATVDGFSSSTSLRSQIIFLFACSQDVDFEFETFTINIDENGNPLSLKIVSEPIQDSSSTTNITIEATFKSFSELNFSRLQPSSNPEIDELKTLFTNLSNNNYTFEYYDAGNVRMVNKVTSYGITTNKYFLDDETKEDQVYAFVNRGTSKSAYVKVSTNDLGYVLTEQQNELNYTVTSTLPTFDLSTSYFTKVDSSYVLNDYLNVYDYVSDLMPEYNYISQLNASYMKKGSFKITLTDDGAIFSYTITDNNESADIVVTFTDIGTTTYDYANAQYVLFKAPTSWADEDATLVEKLNSLFGSYTYIPYYYPGGSSWYYKNVDFNKKTFTLGYYATDFSITNEKFLAYQQIILNAGFSLNSTTYAVTNPDTNVGVMFTNVQSSGTLAFFTVVFYIYGESILE